MFHLYKRVKNNSSNNISVGARGCCGDVTRSRGRRAATPSLVQQLALEPEVSSSEKKATSKFFPRVVNEQDIHTLSKRRSLSLWCRNYIGQINLPSLTSFFFSGYNAGEVG